jgi:hypothetical protein
VKPCILCLGLKVNTRSRVSPFFVKLIRRFSSKAQKRRINLTKKGEGPAKRSDKNLVLARFLKHRLPFSRPFRASILAL